MAASVTARFAAAAGQGACRLGSRAVTDDAVRHPRMTTERLVLLPQTLDSARALLEGEDAGLLLADGYPHADTFDALRMFVEHGSGDDDGGWFVTLADGSRRWGRFGAAGILARHVDAPERANGGHVAFGALIGLAEPPNLEHVHRILLTAFG